jgi:CDP-diacylglycerol---glycerol-3-phosphate 3-phosphatidyltransferase
MAAAATSAARPLMTSRAAAAPPATRAGGIVFAGATLSSSSSSSTPSLLLRQCRRPLLKLAPSSVGRSGVSSFEGGSGTSAFSSSSNKVAAAAGTARGAATTGRSGATAFAGAGPGRSGASSFNEAAAAGKAAAPSLQQPPSSPSLLKSLPTALTVARVLAIPAVVALWFSSAPSAPLWCAALFAASCFTDWLDGYLARALDASTPFGAFLDPVADKLTVAATLVLLCTRAPLPPSPLAASAQAAAAWVVPVASIAIIGREIAMSALREWAATLGPEARSSVAVGGLGKIKTTAQMTAIALLLLTRDGGASAAAVGLSAKAFEAAALAGPPLLIVAAALTKLSLLQYLVALWPWISGKKEPVVAGA